MAEQMTGVLSQDEIKQQIREFLVVNFRYDGEGFDLGDDTSLLGSDTLDQTGVLELVLFVEEAYGFDVDETDLTPENFDTVNNVAAYVAQRLSEADGSDSQ
ncbi:MAG TPA: acyl carrier protein [Ktedonobacterales bacterium]|jgi:acyl carrier protein|nr:acyl carrier protein [Ktedonobacterales bacterium]